MFLSSLNCRSGFCQMAKIYFYFKRFTANNLSLTSPRAKTLSFSILYIFHEVNQTKSLTCTKNGFDHTKTNFIPFISNAANLYAFQQLNINLQTEHVIITCLNNINSRNSHTTCSKKYLNNFEILENINNSYSTSSDVAKGQGGRTGPGPPLKNTLPHTLTSSSITET